MKDSFVERMCACVNQEAIERKEKRARRFHFCGEESSGQRNVLLDKDMMKKGKNPMQVSQTSDCSQVPVCTHHVCVFSLLLWCSAIPHVRLEAIHMTGVDDMSTQDVFGYFKEYPPAHIEWIDDASCEYISLSHTHSHSTDLSSVSMVVVVRLEGSDLCNTFVANFLPFLCNVKSQDHAPMSNHHLFVS